MRQVALLCFILLAGLAGGHTASAAFYPLSGFYPLQQTTARGVYQDSQGCIWLATDLGMWRWVNDHFVPVVGERFQPVKPSGCMLEHNDALWIGADDGLVGIDLSTLTYHDGPSPLNGVHVYDLLRDDSGRLWCAAQDGLHELDLDARPPMSRPVPPSQGRPHFCLAADPTGGVLAGIAGAVVRYQGADGSQADSISVGTGQVRALLPMSDGVLWIGMRDPGGLYRLFDGRLTRLGPQQGLGSDEVNSLAAQTDGEVWVGTQEGVFFYRKDRFQAIDRATGLTSEQVNGVYLDREELVWIATHGGGVYLLRSPYVLTYDVYDRLPHSVIQAIEPCGGGEFLVGTAGGFCRMDARGQIVRRFEHSESVAALHLDDQGRCWAGGSEGLACFDAASGRAIAFTTPPELRDVVAFAEAQDGLLVCADGRLWRILDRHVERIPLDPEASERVPAAQDLFEDPMGGLYLARDTGVWKWDEHGQWVQILVSRQARAMAWDRDGRWWVGTTQGMMTLEGNVFRDVFGRGSPYGEVSDIAVDHQSALWLATPAGLTRYQDGHFVSFGRGDGLPSNDVRCVEVIRPGLLLVGTPQGLAFVESDRFTPSKAAPRVTISMFQAGGESHPLTVGPLDVPNWQRNISISFQGIGFRDEGKGLRYTSRLLGFDENWSAPSQEPKRDFTNLPWGRYRFEVKALNAQGMESPAAASVDFTIAPPVWFSPWFVAAAVVTLSGVSAWVLGNQRRKRQLQKAAEAANVAKSQFLANVSHEIRTPITVILGCTEMMADDRMSGLPLQEGIDAIRRNSNHLLGMINDLLDLSKTEAGHLDVELVPSSVHEILSDVDALMRVSAQRRGLELRIVYENDVPDRILTDPTRLRQTLINLVGNAIKFTGRGHVALRVRVEGRLGKRWLVFDVEDTGIGIPAEKIDTIFEAFTQAEASTTRQYGGTGLGLAIAKSLAERLHGRLSVRSEVGKGSTFTLAIDLEKAGLESAGLETRWVAADDHTRFTPLPPKPGQKREASARMPKLNGRVLLAEDAVDIRGIMRLLLESAGAQVSTAENGPDAVELAYDGGFDAIIMDIHMPGMDGIAAVRELRRRSVETPVVIISADSSPDRQAECRAAGAQGFLPKPFQRKAFLEEIARHLSQGLPQPAPSEHSEDGPILSELDTSSPRMAAAVAEFVHALDERVNQMEVAAQCRDVKTLRHLAHQLRGAGGINGFMNVTDLASQIEESVVNNDLSHIAEQVRKLDRLRRRILAGLEAQSNAECGVRNE